MDQIPIERTWIQNAFYTTETAFSMMRLLSARNIPRNAALRAPLLRSYFSTKNYEVKVKN